MLSKVRFALQTTATRVAIGTAVIWLLLFFWGKHRLWRDPHAGFFNDSAVYDLHYSHQRQLQAAEYLEKAEVNPDLTYESSPNPVICAGIATIPRDNVQYLNATLGSMLVSLTPEERKVLSVRLLFASTDPSSHPDWDDNWLKLLDHYSAYNVSEEEARQLTQWEKEKNFARKGVSDYSYLLRDCFHRTDAPYIAIFEDDILFAEGWLSKTLDALAELRQKSTEWVYLRLFYTETFLFWKDDDFWYSHLLLTYGLAISLTAISLLVLRTFSRLARSHLDNTTLLVLAFITVPAFVTLTFMFGKYNLMPMNGSSRMNDMGCCTQALVFTRTQAVDIMELLEERKVGQTDLLIEEYANNMGLERYALAPPQVQHMGVISSRGASKLQSQSTWAFWFEANDPAGLHREHSKLSRWGIWRASSDSMS